MAGIDPNWIEAALAIGGAVLGGSRFIAKYRAERRIRKEAELDNSRALWGTPASRTQPGEPGLWARMAAMEKHTKHPPGKPNDAI